MYDTAYKASDSISSKGRKRKEKDREEDRGRRRGERRGKKRQKDRGRTKEGGEQDLKFLLVAR